LVDSPRDKRRAVFAGAAALLVALALVLIFRSGSSRSHLATVLPAAPKLESVVQIRDLPAPEPVAPVAEPEPVAPAPPSRTTTAGKRTRTVAHHATHSKPSKHDVARGARANKAARRVAIAKGGTVARGVGADAGDPRPSYERGTSHLFAGDEAGAIAAFRDAVRKAPHDPIGYRGLGLAYEQKGDTAAAVRALRQYLKLAPSAPDRAIIARRIDRLSKAATRK
jgi:tetratricopeptide (TPR) repeat protein